MTPDSDSMRTNNTGGGGTGGMGSSNSGGANARSGSMSMDKSDIFGVRPASSGSANNSGFVVNPENLLNAAAQMASAFAASDMDYLGKYFIRDHSYITSARKGRRGVVSGGMGSSNSRGANAK